MKNSLAIASVALAASIANAFPPSRNHVEHFFGSVGQQIKLRVDFTANPSLLDPVTANAALATQNQAPWGLARISHTDKLVFGTFNKYVYDPDAGLGVNVYVIDTGVNLDHDSFEGRGQWGETILDNSADEDEVGTGTHLAGIIASRDYGVAKKAKIIAVKSLGLDNPNATDIIKGVKWAIADHQSQAGKNAYPIFKGSVIMLNLGSWYFDIGISDIVNAAYDAGIHIAVSAGNDNADACAYGAGKTRALTVGGTTLSDDRAHYSNYGPCVDLFAPSLNCRSTSIGGRTNVAMLSGTEQAAAHVAGLLAYIVSLAPQGQASPDSIKKKILDLSLKGLVSDLPDETVNLLAFNGAGSS